MRETNYLQETAAEGFARRLKKLRKDQYMTQKQLAHEAKISLAYASKLEQGQTIPSDPILENIAVALGCDAAWLRNGNPRDIQLDELIGSVDTHTEGVESVHTAEALQCRQILRDSLQDINNLISILREADGLYDLDSLQAIYQYLHVTVQMADTIQHAKKITSPELRKYCDAQLAKITQVLKQIADR